MYKSILNNFYLFESHEAFGAAAWNLSAVFTLHQHDPVIMNRQYWLFCDFPQSCTHEHQISQYHIHIQASSFNWEIAWRFGH